MSQHTSQQNALTSITANTKFEHTVKTGLQNKVFACKIFET